jgi:hypothetical protein
MTSRPRPSFRRHPAKEAAIRKTGMPFAATTREGNVRGEIALSGLRAGSLAHAAHTFSPGWGECFEGHCKCHGAVTRESVTVPSADGSRVQTPFLLSLLVPGTDDPSTPESSTDLAVDGADCPARTNAGRSA